MGNVHPPPRNGVGSTALVFGIVALLFSFVPVVGEFAAIPAAIAAVVMGIIGFGRAEKGLATNSGEALAGAILGVISGFVMLLIFAATMAPAT